MVVVVVVGCWWLLVAVGGSGRLMTNSCGPFANDSRVEGHVATLSHARAN